MIRARDGEAITRRLAGSFPHFEALPSGVFVVGGAVRDAILGRRPVDLDLAARDGGAAAEAFASRANARVVDLGRERFRTWRVTAKGHVYDFNDIVGSSIEEDLGRRDFTINAIALDPAERRLVDPHGGGDDAAARSLRMVRESNFVDDPLRVLKGVRLAAALQFAIEPATLEAMRRHAPKAADVAAERVTYELQLAFRADAERSTALLHDTGLDLSLFGGTIRPRALEALGRTKVTDPVVAFWIVLEPAEVDAFAARWRWSEELRRDVHALGRAVDRIERAKRDEGDLAVALHDAGRRTAKRALSALLLRGSEDVAALVERMIAAKGEAIFAVKPLLTGHEIAAIAGIRGGPRVGEIKRALLEKQIRGEIGDRAAAEEFVRRLSS